MPNTHANSVSAVNIPTTTETAIVAISPAVAILAPGGEGVTISGVVNVTAGTGTTAVSIRVRRSADATGTQVGPTITHTLAAGASASIPFCHLDSSASALAANADQWAVTVQQTGATANGTANYATINAESCNAVE